MALIRGSQISGSVASASFATTASFALNAVSASFASTASFVQNAQTASFITASNVYGPYGSNSILSASSALTASYITGSIFTSANPALSASYALTASFIQNAQTASYVTGSIFTSANPALSASYALSSSFALTASYLEGYISPFPFTGSAQITGSLDVTGSLTATTLTASNAIISGNVTVLGTASINTLVVNQTILSTGSNQLGDNANDTQTLWGTIDIKTGPVLVTGSLNVSNGITGSLLGTSSFATSASYAAQAVTASFATTASYVENAQTASFVQSAVSASFALSSSFASTVPAEGVIGLNLSQIATGSVTASVSPTQFTVVSGSSTELVVTGTGVTIGNALTDTHSITGSLSVTGSINSLFIGRGNGNIPTNISIGASTNFSGSTTGTNNVAIGSGSLARLTNGTNNIAIGYRALCTNTTGASNTAIGTNTLLANTSGARNTAIGVSALCANTSGIDNIAIGCLTLRTNTTGGRNTAIGFNALSSNTTGTNNTGIGTCALRSNTTGGNNTAIGNCALNANTTGCFNTAIGGYALCSNTSGTNNTAIGYKALTSNTTGGNNTAIGNCALNSNTTGRYNVALGLSALLLNTTGNSNIAIGLNTLIQNTSGSDNIAIGCNVLGDNLTGNSNIAIGYRALRFNATGSNNITIGPSAARFNSMGANLTNLSSSIVIGANTKPSASGDINEIVIGDSAIGLGSNTTVIGNSNTTTARIWGQLTANSFTGSLLGTSSYAIQALSASYALTASYVNPLYQNIILSGALDLSPTTDPDYTGTITTDTFLFQSSSNTPLGYDLYIRQNGNLVKWKWVEGILETGLLYGGVVTYSGSFVYVSSGSGIIAEHNASTGSEISPTITYVTWPAITQSITNIATQQVTYLYIDNNGNLQQQSTRFTSQQYHSYIPLGAVGHFDYTQISAFGGGVQTAYDQISQISNFVDAFGPLKMSGYGLTGQVGSLRLSVGSGTSFIHGGFYQNNPEFPSQITTPSQTTASLARVYRSGSVIEFDTNAGNLYTVVDPTKYDRDGDGTLANVGNGNWSIQRVFSDPKTGVLYVYYGQARYTSLLNALQFLPTDPFTEGDTFDFTTFLGFLVLKGNASDITDTANNSIINGGLFRGSGQGSGGGIALSNLEDLTDVSITGPVNGQALIYNSGLWINGNPSSASYASTASYVTGSIFTSANPALSASYALTASYLEGYISPFPFTGSAQITGSLEVTGSITTSGLSGTINNLFINTGNGNVSTNVSIGATTAFSSSITGTNNISIGSGSLGRVTSGVSNIGIGQSNLRVNTTGNRNVAIGSNILIVNTSGDYNVAIGGSVMCLNTTGGSNIAMGVSSLRANTTGGSNIAIGVCALRYNTTANHNIAMGRSALQQNTTGCRNVAIGLYSLCSNITGSYNVALGVSALRLNTSGRGNTAIGNGTLNANTTGLNNVAIGLGGLAKNTTGAYNVAIVESSLYNNTTGCHNVAVGSSALSLNTTGNFNIAIGEFSMQNSVAGFRNIAIGRRTARSNSGNNNIAIGDCALSINSGNGTTGNNNIALGYKANCAINYSQNNIVIGTNIGVEESSANKINIGGLIFGSGSHSNSGSAVFSGSSNGFVGINQPNPQYNLDISGSLGLNQAAFINQNTASLALGTQTISTNATGSFNSAFYNYVLFSGSNARAGQVMSVWNGGSIRFTDVTTTDIGSTVAVALTASLSGPNVILSSTLPTSGWTFETVVNLI